MSQNELEYGNPYELLYYFRLNDSFAFSELLRIYSPLIYYVMSAAVPKDLEAYNDDLFQEGVIALSDAADTYREDMDCGFTTFAVLLIRRRMVNTLRRYKRRGYYGTVETGGSWISLDSLVCEGSRWTLADVTSGGCALFEPEYYLEYRLAEERLEKVLNSLRKEEKCILEDSERYPYSEVCGKYQLSAEAFGNRVYRIKAKVKKRFKKAEKCH